jgi:hypothetical protein
MSDVPNFGELLAGMIGTLPDSALPGLLCGLERAAGARYRQWAEASSGSEAEMLLACAEREEEISRRVAKLLPTPEAERGAVEACLPDAIATYRDVFEGLPLLEQLRIQAAAELQGAAAWRGIADRTDDPQVRAGLEGCAVLEEETSRAVADMLAKRA